MKALTPKEILKEIENEYERNRQVSPAFDSNDEVVGAMRRRYLDFERAMFHGAATEQAEEAIKLAATALRFIQCRVEPYDLVEADKRMADVFRRRLDKQQRRKR